MRSKLLARLTCAALFAACVFGLSTAAASAATLNGAGSTLVAPIEVGQGGYVGAGSVITDPVPPKALALGRGRQVNKEGWVKKKKEPKAEALSNAKK